MSFDREIIGSGLTKANSEFRTNSPTGYGSTNTLIRKWPTAVKAASFVTHTQSATLGDTFEITEKGLYYLTTSDRRTDSAAMTAAISLNTATPTTAFFSLTEAEKLAWDAEITQGTADFRMAHRCVWLDVGDILRVHAHTAQLSNETGNSNAFLHIIQMIKS